MPKTEAQKRATKKWDMANKEIKTYSTYKSSAKKFINKYSKMEDLNLLKKLIEEREKFLLENKE